MNAHRTTETVARPAVDRYPPGVPCWIDTTHRDVAAAGAFYAGLFGWQLRAPADGGDRLIASLDGQDVAGIGSRPGGPARSDAGPAWVTYVRVAEVDATAAAVRAAGGRVDADPVDVPGEGRSVTVADPSGAVLRLWQPAGHTGAGTVNADGTWNWSNLVTPDPATALEFYPAVLGWRALSFGPAAPGSSTDAPTMWTRPGYSDVLEQLDPTLRERHGADAVPDGFSDAIGWLAPDPSAGTAHWAVTFAVDDTDAVVARAVELGGTVAVPAHDTPPVRSAELVDPQGLRFTVNTYRPEG